MIDLRGNTNFAAFKNLQDEYIVPRTNLAAVDMDVANGLAVDGSTLYVNLATDSDIEYGTTGSIVDASTLKTALDTKQGNLEAGTGIEIVSGETASTISVPITDVEMLIDGTTATKVVDVAALRGALTTGQAVDVTSVPDQTITGDYKGTFATTATTLGFASFPKYAAGLNYLMIADVTVASARNITPSGTWIDGSTSAKALAANTATRVAMLFNAANKGKFTFSGSGTVTVSNLREYEVTACTTESIAYIASLSNPDVFADYYLVKADMVQPWTYIIDMGTSSAVTIAAGLSYKLNASTGTHTLTVDTCPEGYDGRDAIIRIRLGGNGVVQAVAPLQLGGALVPYAINNCVVKFRDGEAVLIVEDTLAGYVVTVTSGTDSGSLAYGLAATGIPYIAFSTGTDGSVVNMGNAVTANEEVTVVGNGRANTTIEGNVTCSNVSTFTNITFYGSAVANGSLTLADGEYHLGTVTGTSDLTIGSGSTVDITGNTNTIPIDTDGGVTVEDAVQFINASGSTVGIDPRTYAAINSDGTTEPAKYVYGYAQGITQGTSNYVPIVLENNVISRVSALDKTKMSCHERRICVMDDLATRHINYYLNPEDLTKKMDGTPSNLDGTDGDVMTEFMPAYYLELTLAPQNDTENRNCVLMSRYPFSYTDGNNVEHVAAYHDSFKISPTGDVVRPQYVGYYQATTQTVNGTNKLRSISSTSNKYVYPTVSLRLGPGSASTPTQDSFLVRAENNGGTICNELHYEWLFHLFVCDKLTVDTQSASIGFCYADNSSWGTIYPRACGYTNQVSNFYGGQTLADDRDVDMVPLWNNCTITANGLSWRTNAAACVWAADATTGKRVVSTYAWKNGNDLVYTKASDGLPAAGTKCYSDNACTVEAYTITASASPTAAANKVTSCKYFIENPWSSIWQNLAGFAPFVTGSTLGYFGTTSINRYKEILLTTTSQAGSDISASGGNVAIKWTNHTWPQANNYVTTWNMTTFLPITATSTNVMRDYFYTDATNANPRAGFRGGYARNTSNDGLGSVGVPYVVGSAYASIGARLAA